MSFLPSGWRGGAGSRRLRSAQPKSRSTPWSAWLASDSAVCESCWRVLRASRLAPSSFESASTRLSAPVLQRRDHVLGEILAGLHHREVGAERRGRGAQRGQGRGQRVGGRGRDRAVVLEVDVDGARSRSTLGDAEIVGVDVSGPGCRACSGCAGLLVENDRELVAGQQVDAVIAGVLGELVDLRAQVVELGDQRLADRAFDRRDTGGGVGAGEAEQRIGIGGGLRRGGRRRRVCAAAEADLQLVGGRGLDRQLAVIRRLLPWRYRTC